MPVPFRPPGSADGEPGSTSLRRPATHPTPPAASGPGQRARGDRRSGPTPRFSRYALTGGRRSWVRRSGELEGSFVDRHGWRMIALLAWVALLNAGDSFFTLYHLQAGGVELNPVAAAMLRTGRLGFVISKSVLIAVPLVILCVHKNFPLARLGLWTAAVTYTALLTYHLYLL